MGSICRACLLSSSRRRKIDEMLFLERREPFREVARRSKMSRQAVQKHYRHLVEGILAQEASASPASTPTSTVVFAPVVNVVVLPQDVRDGEPQEPIEEKEGEMNNGIAEQGGGGHV